MHTHAAGFLQRFQAQCGGRDFGLLIRCLTEVRSERAPESLEAEQRDRGRARGIAAIAKARSVTKDSDQFGRPAIVEVCHSRPAYHGADGLEYRHSMASHCELT